LAAKYGIAIWMLVVRTADLVAHLRITGIGRAISRHLRQPVYHVGGTQHIQPISAMITDEFFVVWSNHSVQGRLRYQSGFQQQFHRLATGNSK
jgi:hypothetical protein